MTYIAHLVNVVAHKTTRKYAWQQTPICCSRFSSSLAQGPWPFEIIHFIFSFKEETSADLADTCMLKAEPACWIAKICWLMALVSTGTASNCSWMEINQDFSWHSPSFSAASSSSAVCSDCSSLLNSVTAGLGKSGKTSELLRCVATCKSKHSNSCSRWLNSNRPMPRLKWRPGGHTYLQKAEKRQ